ELDPGPELGLAGGADAHVGVTAEAPLLEVPVVHADEDEELAEDAQVLGRLGRAPQIGLADDLDQGRPGAVQVDDRAPPEVDVLAGVLLHVDPGDADDLLLPVDLDLELAATAEGLVVLAYLVALGEVGVKVVLAGEAAPLVDPARERQG